MSFICFLQKQNVYSLIIDVLKTLTKYASKNKYMKLHKIGNSIEEFYNTFSCTLGCKYRCNRNLELNH